MKRVLILGGTGDAADLATQLLARSTVDVITSLAGRTRHPNVVAGRLRVGGFGGATGLAAYLRQEQIDGLIDATHPFAAQISWNAAAAALDVGIPHLIVVRPAWEKMAGDTWIEVESVEAAAKSIPETAQRVFLSIGRQQIALFSDLPKTWFLMRSIDAPVPDSVIPNGTLLLDRGPFQLEQERHLLREYRIDAIVSKNSGGTATYAKVIAARELGIPVVMIQRPALPLADQVADVEQAVVWLLSQNWEGL